MPNLTEDRVAITGRKRELSHTKKPEFFIVGAPKCGTSALAHYLAAHPDIYVARKEMHFFGADLHFGQQFYRRDLNAYLAEFDTRHDQACAGEASVWYLFSRQAAAEIKAFNPDARIIILLREPAAMLYSLYYQFRSDGNEHLPTFAEALAAEDDRRAGRRLGRQTYLAQGLAYRAVVRYTEQVRRYFETFGRERVHVILYDELAANTAGTYRDTLRFLGADPAGINLDFGVINGNKSVRSPALRAVLQDPLVRGTAIALFRRLPRPFSTVLQKCGTKLSDLNLRPEKRPPLAADLRLALSRELAPEVEQLSVLLGRDLSHWSQPVPARADNPLRAVSAAANRPACRLLPAGSGRLVRGAVPRPLAHL
jgi:hypothetical protein